MGIGGAVTIVLSLLIPAYLIYEFDAGLNRERKYFGYWLMDNEGVVGFSSFGYCCGFASDFFVGLAIAGIAEEWYPDMADAFFLVLSGMGLFSFVHTYYLWKVAEICKLQP